jgi:hypothetical protein
VALPIDPGEHVVVTRDPAGNETRATVTVAAGEAVRLELRVPEAALAPAPPAVPTPVVLPSRLLTAAPPVAADEPSSPLRSWAWIAGGIGVSGVVVGSIAGGVALAKKGEVSDHCRGEECNSTGKRAADAGQSAATVSTVAFGVGLVGLGTSLLLLLTSDTGTSSSTQLRPNVSLGADRAFAGLEGVF